MAGTTVTVQNTGEMLKEPEAAFRTQINNIITDLETLRAAIDTIADQLDADATVTDTDYAANAAVATAATLVAATINTW